MSKNSQRQLLPTIKAWLGDNVPTSDVLSKKVEIQQKAHKEPYKGFKKKY